MNKIILLLLMAGIFAQPNFATTNNSDEKIDLTPKIKKGDWFIIEFANQLEDYSTPVDSINYCDPIDLKQLVLKCVVVETSAEKINLKITSC